MRNLKLLQSFIFTDEEFQDASHLCVDSETDTVYFVTPVKICSVDILGQNVLSCTLLNREVTEEKERVIGVIFLPEQQSVCLAVSSGDIILYNVFTKEVEYVGDVTSGLCCMSWSPDQELVVLLTGDHKLVLMTKDFDVITEKYLHPEEFGENKPITVGWGAKETQFHGSEGKDAAKIKKKEPQQVFEWDDKQCRISWRGDGHLFVTSAIDPHKGFRKLRIWNRLAHLIYTCEDVDGLEQSLEWRPSGNLIVSTKQSPNKHEVVFYEKNGLRHGEFTLPFSAKTFYVKETLWNSDSSVLLVWGHNLPLETDSLNLQYSVMLWTVNNYHWYLKQTLQFTSKPHNVIKFVLWDLHHPYRLHILCSEGKYLQYSWTWSTNHSLGQSSSDPATVAVIDGAAVMITPFKYTIIPPPLCDYSVHLPCSVNQIIFSQSPESSDFALVLADSRIAFFKNGPVEEHIPDCDVKIIAAGGSGFSVNLQKQICYGIFRFTWEDSHFLPSYPESLYHWLWISKDILFCVAHQDCTNVLISVQVQHKEMCLIGRTCSMLEDFVIGMCSNEEATCIILQLKDGTILKYDCEECLVQPFMTSSGKELKFPQPCVQMFVIEIRGVDVLLGLTDRFTLYCNDVVIASNCTSFYLHDEFLLLTTHDHTLRTLLKDNLTALLQGKEIETISDYPRKLERGSRLVVTVPTSTEVILQMPRGNLEVIHPRPLVLTAVCKLLDSLQYEKALQLMKKHRINMNLIYDHNPKKFLDNIDKIVHQVNSASSLNLFLTGLQAGNVTEDMYSSIYKMQNKKNSSAEIDNKINTVCDAVRKALEKLDDDRFMLSILATYVMKIEPELDIALKKIKELSNMPEKNDTKNVLVDEALQFLLYMVDVDTLYNVALGTYDFDIVLMVAEKSQKDPKEYIPFLNELQKLTLDYQRYKIDMHLCRYKKALQNISKCENHFAECLSLIKSQRLYTDALYLFPSTSHQFKEVWDAYGDYLVEKKYYDEAGLVYTRCEKHNKALIAYQQSHNWQLMLSAAIKLGLPSENIASLARNMAETLKASGMFSEAALLLELYTQGIEDSIATLIEGQEWDAALRMMFTYKHLDLIETHLRPALMDQCLILNESCDQIIKTFQKYCTRLKVVRINKQMSGDSSYFIEDYHPEADLYSDTSSITGVSHSVKSTTTSAISGSIMTRRSKRTKKKEELKKYSLKEGSAYEDLALISALSELILSAEKLKEGCNSLLRTLVQFGYDQEGQCLQKKLRTLHQIVEKEIPNIWPQDKDEDTSSLIYGPSATVNTIVAAVQRQKKIQPVISDPKLRNPPCLKADTEWMLNILQ